MAFCFGFLTGCVGYTLGPTPPTYMKGVHRVAVPILKNATTTPDIQAVATTTMISQIQQDGTYEVTGVDQADAIVVGTITFGGPHKIAFTPGKCARLRGICSACFINFRIEKPDTGQLMNQKQIEGDTSFFVGNDIYTQEREAIPLAMQDAAVQFVSFLSEGW